MLKHEDSSRAEMGREGRGVRQLIALLALAFVVTLGVVVGTRMSSDAIAVLVGVIAGVAASIPCALLLMAVTRRQEPQEDAFYGGAPRDGTRYGNSRAAPPVTRQHLSGPPTSWSNCSPRVGRISSTP